MALWSKSPIAYGPYHLYDLCFTCCSVPQLIRDTLCDYLGVTTCWSSLKLRLCLSYLEYIACQLPNLSTCWNQFITLEHKLCHYDCVTSRQSAQRSGFSVLSSSILHSAVLQGWYVSALSEISSMDTWPDCCSPAGDWRLRFTCCQGELVVFHLAE